MSWRIVNSPISILLQPVEQLVNAASGQDVDTVLVDGEIILQNRKVQRGA